MHVRADLDGEDPATPEPAASAAPTLYALATPKPRAFGQLQAQISGLAASSGTRIGISLIELGGTGPQAWNVNGDQSFVAASTYKLPLLMDEAQLVSSGRETPEAAFCFQPDDWEDGWFADYTPGECFTLAQLAGRIGQDSDNTAAHILVRYLGGAAALNAYAQAEGAGESAFFYPNVTTANDLARLLASEAQGQAGGAAAQQWLYPLLTRTAFENGIPAGLPASATVVHKIGTLDSVDNDAALVLGGVNGPYVLAVCTDGPGGDALIAQISAAVWQFESAR